MTAVESSFATFGLICTLALSTYFSPLFKNLLCFPLSTCPNLHRRFRVTFDPLPHNRTRSRGTGTAHQRASVRWIACQPDTCQRVYFSNHTSHLDALLIWSSLPLAVRELTRPVAAKDYWTRGFVRRWLALEVFHALLIDRTDIKVHQSPIDLMLWEIGSTKSLIVFPEGSRSVTGEVGEFKSGLYYLSKTP